MVILVISRASDITYRIPKEESSESQDYSTDIGTGRVSGNGRICGRSGDRQDEDALRSSIQERARLLHP
jgi:hypothetical protein